MVQALHSPDPLVTIPKEVFLSCAGVHSRMEEIKQKTSVLIEDCIAGDVSRVEAITAQIDPKKKTEFELMARAIISKALDEPQHCKACVSLSGALNVLLPALPSGTQGKKNETFLHAVLDVFQTEFEEISVDSSERTFENDEDTGAALGGLRATQINPNRIRAVVHFAGHLYCHGLLGNGVVRMMVQELLDNGEAEAAHELLWFIGAVNNNVEQQHCNLGTVLEDVEDRSDGASSEGISSAERRRLSSS